MKLFATSDLHLTISVPEKSMSKFGPNWENHTEKIIDGWNSTVNSDDIVIIAGDISWATTIEQASADFDFIESLPGKKILTIGNHDYWHQTATKSYNHFFDNYKTMVPLVRNDYMPLYGQVAICAVKGYMNETHPEFKQEYEKGYNRECTRLENTLKIIPSTFETKLVVSHYPPIHNGYSAGKNRAFSIMQNYGVDKCIYGHLHAEAVSGAYIGVSGCTDFIFVAGDSHNFEPLYVRDI